MSTTPSGRSQYATGRVRSRVERITGLVLNPDVPPDLMVELLPAVWWLENAVGYSTNRCASACVALQYAYAAMGITARPVAVELLTEDRRTGERTHYGRPDPHWDGTTFLGHCALSLPGSGRFIDPTVEQYPEVRGYDLGPICGRTVLTRGSAEQRAIYRDSGLQPGSEVHVARGELELRYTAAAEQYRDVVTEGPFIRDKRAEFERAGRVIAAQALLMLAWPEVIDRAQRAPHPRVRALVSILAGAEIVESGDDEDVQLLLAGETTVRGFDEILAGLPR